MSGADRLGELLGRETGAQERRPLVGVAMANNPEVIGCIGAALESGAAGFVLLGPADEIRSVASAHGVDLAGATIEEERDGREACRRVARLAAEGAVDAVMKGLVQTGDFVKALLDRELGLVPAGGLLSHVALFDVPAYDRLFLLTDAAITTYPDVDQKAALLANAVRIASRLSMIPVRAALVTAVERVSEKIASTVDAAELVRRRREGALPMLEVADGQLFLDGPFGLDVAVSPVAAAIKGISGEVAGKANLLLMPSIDAANVLYKSLTCLAGARVAGVVAGARVPVVLTSRSDSEATKYQSLLLALCM